jgi:hypothetical protein
MNNKQAKKLRRVARLLAKAMDLPAKDYLTQNRTKPIMGKNGKPVLYPVSSVRLNPKSTRFLYKKLKREFKTISHVSKQLMYGEINETSERD